MPTLGYLSMQGRNIVNEPWQVWVIGVLAAVMLGVIIWGVIESRKW